MRNRLKEFRIRSGLSQEALADLAGLSFGYLSRIERWERPLSKKWAVALAPHLGTSWTTLMDEPATGFADATTDLAPPPSEQMIDPEEAFAQIQEAVAEMLKAEHLPHAQADIARVSRMVERDMLALGRMRNFADGLEITLSEVASSLKRKWAEALTRR